MSRNIIFLIICTLTSLISCDRNGSLTDDYDSQDSVCLVERVDTCSLILLFPQYSNIDLVCAKMPSLKNDSVLLCAEACFTGQCLKNFDHFNIAGDHVSGGKRFHGYKCKRNTGAFVYYNTEWKFLCDNYSSAMDTAEKNGGCAFAQEMIVHNGQFVNSIRKDSNRNQFRALCQINGKLCVAESDKIMSYSNFKKALMNAHATEAIYLDMGNGWNYAWYRTNNDSITVLHPKTHNYCTNWITFYK